MPTQTFPNVQPSSVSWDLIDNSRQFASPHTGAVQVEQRGGQRLMATLDFANKADADRRALIGFLALVTANADPFNLPAFGMYYAGAGGGTPRGMGGSQTGTSLETDGWPNSTVVMRAGDPFDVNGELKICAADVTSNGSGQATVEFFPELRSAPADNALLDLTDPSGVFRIPAGPRSFSLSPRSADDAFASMTIVCVEDVLA